MRIPFFQTKLKADERRAILQAMEIQMQQVIIDGVPRHGSAFLEQEVRSSVDAGFARPRWMSNQPRPID